MPTEVVTFIIEARDLASGELRKIQVEGKTVGDTVSKAGKRGEESFKRMSRSVDVAKGALAALVAQASLARLTQLLRRTILSVIAFDDALIGIGKTTNLTGRELDDLGDKLVQLAQDIAVPERELLKIAEIAGQLGIAGSANIEKFTETVGRLVISSNLSGEQAATGLARLLAVTGENVESVDKLASVITRLGNNFAATESEILHLANEVARGTTIFGVSASEAAAFGVVLKELGNRAQLGGSALGRAMRTMNTAIKEGGEEQEKFAIIMGRSGEEIERIFGRDATEAMFLFLEGLKRVDEEGGNVAGVLAEVGIAGDEMNKVLPPLALRVDRLREAFAQQKEELASANALMDESTKAIEGLGGQTRTLGNVWGETMREIGKTAPISLATAALRELGKVITGLIRDARGLPEAIAGRGRIGPSITDFARPGRDAFPAPLQGEELERSRRELAILLAEQAGFRRVDPEVSAAREDKTIEAALRQLERLKEISKGRLKFEQAFATASVAIEEARAKEVLSILKEQAKRNKEFLGEQEKQEQAVANRMFDLREAAAAHEKDMLADMAQAVRDNVAARQGIIQGMIQNELLSDERRSDALKERFRSETKELQVELDKRLISLQEFNELRSAMEQELSLNIKALTEDDADGTRGEGFLKGLRDFGEDSRSEFEKARAFSASASESIAADAANWGAAWVRSAGKAKLSWKDLMAEVLADLAKLLIIQGIKLLFAALVPGAGAGLAVGGAVAPGTGGTGAGSLGFSSPGRGGVSRNGVSTPPPGASTVNQFFIEATDPRSFRDMLKDPLAMREVATQITEAVRNNAGTRQQLKSLKRDRR